MGLREPDERVTEVIAAVRAAAPRSSPSWWTSATPSTRWSGRPGFLETWEPFDLFFVETPLWSDDLEGYAELARRVPMKLAAGESAFDPVRIPRAS